jgi:hypothetical protein
VSEWIGWVGRLRRLLYASLEELSFRTGAAAVAGVLAVAATAILLTLTQGGHRAAPLPRIQAAAAPSTVALAPPTVALSPATHPAHHGRAAAAPFASYAPAPPKKPTPTPQPSPSSTSPTPRRTRLRYPPHSGSPISTSPGTPLPFPTTSDSLWERPN